MTRKLQRIIREGGRRGEIYAGLKFLSDQYGDLVRARYPDIPRRVSGYNLNQLLPENGFHVARALVGSEGTCVTVLEATCRLVQSPPERVLLVIAYAGRLSSAPIMFRKSWRIARLVWRALTICVVCYNRRQGDESGGNVAVAGRGRMADGRVRRGHRVRGGGPGAAA